MEVLIFQVCLASIILISSFFGRKIRNWLILFVCIFTVVMVFMTWLILLQFVTIFISYSISESIIQNAEIARENKRLQQNQNSGNGKFYFILFLIVSGIFYSISVSSKRTDSDKINEEQTITEKHEKNVFNYQSYQDSLAGIATDADSYNSDSIAPESLHNDYDSLEYPNNNLHVDEEDINTLSNENIESGQFLFLKSRIGNADFGKFTLEKIDNNRFKFRLFVENNFSTGDISGIAITTAPNHALYSDQNCRGLEFDFFENGYVKITELECANYHGTKITFNTLFKQ